MYFLPQRARQKCPYSSFVGKKNWKVNPEDKNFYTDNFGFRASFPPEEAEILVLGSSTVMGPPEYCLTDWLNKKSGKKCYGIACGSWMASQMIAQYLFKFSHMGHKNIIILAGYNDIYSPFSYDPRPQYPHNFFIDELLFEKTLSSFDAEKGLQMKLDIDLSSEEILLIRESISESQPDGMHELFSKFLNSINILQKFCYSSGINLYVVPQMTIWDKRFLSEKEVSFSADYIKGKGKEINKLFWRFISSNPSHFIIPQGTMDIINSKKHLFTDPVHLTEDGYDVLSDSLVNLI